MKKVSMRYCSLLLIIVMVINMIPMNIFANEIETDNDTEENTVTIETPEGIGIEEESEIRTEPTLETEEELEIEPGTLEETIPDTEAETIEDAYIVEEIAEKRTEYSKEYLLSNGLHMMTMYADPVHYEVDGEWEEIDNTLELEDGLYTNTEGVWDVSFPAEIDSETPVTINKDGYSLSFYMAGEMRAEADMEIMSIAEDAEAVQPFVVEAQKSDAMVKPIDLTEVKEASEHPETVSEKTRSRLEYEDVYENTDVRYDLQSNQLKESIIIGEYDETVQGYTYVLRTGSLQPVLTESGEILLYDENQENVVMVMPAPYLLDSAGERCDDVDVTLEGNDGVYALVYTLPQEWMSSADRQWPVILDPIVGADISMPNIGDVCVYERNADRIESDISKIYINGALDVGSNNLYGVMRTYLQYHNLPALSSADVIVGAQVAMYAGSYNAAHRIEVRKILETWDSKNVFWETQPEFSSTVEDYVRINAIEDWYTWDVTDIVREWYEGENTGMVFKLRDSVEGGTTEYRTTFLSSEYSDYFGKPQLNIYFRNNNGLESYWDYTASSTTRAGTGYINNYTGNLTWIHEDMGFGGTRTSVTINHIYNANDSNKEDDKFGLGIGWRTNYNQRVYTWPGHAGYYVWEDADGTAHYFAYSSEEGKYKDEDGLELTLIDTGSGASKYCITDKKGNRSYFDTKGRLRKISSNQQTPSNITITYTTTDGYKINTITDGASRVYYFTYNGNGLLNELNYKGNNENLVVRSLAFTYTSSRLTTITYQDGETTKFSYKTNNDNEIYLISKVTDIDGYNLNYTYTTVAKGKPARVASVTEKAVDTVGGSLAIQYGHNQTTFTDQSGNKQIAQFNNWGNTISIQDDLGRAQYGRYTSAHPSDGGKGNQLRLSSKLQNTVGNRMAAGNFDNSPTWSTSSDNISFQFISGTAYSGNKSLKATTTADAVSPNVYSPSYTVANGKTVTFSAYVKTGAAPSYLTITDGTKTIKSEALDQNSDWTRLQVSYTNKSGDEKSIRCRLVVKGQGVTYMDCVQLEDAAVASRFNLVANGDFRYTGYWNETSRYTLGTSYAAPAPELNNVVHKVTGSPSSTNRISQTINVGGAGGDCYVLAGWAKGYSVPLEPADEHSSNTREFGIIATFNNTDGSKTTAELHFNDCVASWQYAAQPIVAEKAYDSIKIELAYDYNANIAYFDGIQLFNEQFGQSYTYDSKGNVISVVDLQNQETTYEFDTDNDLIKETLPTGAKLTYTYDDYHNVLTATTETDVKYEFTYDTYGNNTSVSVVNGTKKITSSATYTADANRIATMTDAAGNVTTYNYTKNANNLTWVQYPEDTEATRTDYTYDQWYRLLVGVTADTSSGETLEANYTYTDDQLSTITTGSTTYNFAYGDFAQTSSIKVGTQTLATYTYTDETNYLKKLAYGNGDSVSYTYDKHGRVTKQTYEDGETVEYLYDNDGNLTTVVDSESGITSYTSSDFVGRNAQYREVGDDYEASLTYHYDENNLITKIVELIGDAKRNIFITYDDDNRVATWRKYYSKVNYTYDAYGRVSSMKTEHTNTSTEILTESYTYYSPGTNLSSTQVSKYKTTSTGDYDVTYTYTYDDNGNILSVSDGTNQTTYVYDSANQLLRENNQAAGTTTVWTYDDAGNILTRKEYAYTTGAVGTETDSVNYTYGNSNWGDQLTSYDGQTITYDQIGNPLTDGTWTYTWKHGRELESMTKGSTTWEYTYNADGLRTKRTDGTNTYEYVYLDGQLVQLTVNDNGTEVLMKFAYDADGTPLSITYKGIIYYYVTNLQGDVVGIVNQSGNLLVSYTYDAWGNILNTTGSNANALGKHNPLRYRGYVYDEGTGLYYLQSRYYDPEMGRFINADSHVTTGQGFLGHNMFVYCGNNPVSRSDPAGDMFVIEKCGAGPRMDSASGFFGLGIVQSEKYKIIEFGTVICGTEDGFSESKVLLGDISKPVSFYLEVPSQRWMITDYKRGIQINTSNGGFSYSKNWFEKCITYAHDGRSYEVIVGTNKLGYTIKTGVDFEKKTAESYDHAYIRPIPTVALVLGVAAVGSFFGGFAAAAGWALVL